MTLRQLATHTAGLPIGPGLDLEEASTETILANLKDVERTFPPLTEFKYSNLGFGLLGHALSRIAEQRYEDYIEEHILQPLRMNHSGFALAPEMRPYVATGYESKRDADFPKPLVPAPHHHSDNLMAAADGLHSSVEDMACFISLQFRDGKESTGGGQILRGSSILEMHTVQWINPDWQSGWSIGFAVFRGGPRVVIGHAGGATGFQTAVALRPKAKIGIAVFTNSGAHAGPAPFQRKAMMLMVPVIERVVARQKKIEPTPLPTNWEKYVGRYVSQGGDEREIKLVDNFLVLTHPHFPEIVEAVTLTEESEPKFRMKGGAANGELLEFELDAAGNITGMRVGSAFAMDRKR